MKITLDTYSQTIHGALFYVGWEAVEWRGRVIGGRIRRILAEWPPELRPEAVRMIRVGINAARRNQAYLRRTERL